MGQPRRHRKGSLIISPSVPMAIRRQMPVGEEIYCQMCGICRGDIDKYTGRAARFVAEWVPNNGLGLLRRRPEVRILCSTCNQGAKNITTEKPTSIWLLSQVRRAGIHEQRSVFEWLAKKFGNQA